MITNVVLLGQEPSVQLLDMFVSFTTLIIYTTALDPVRSLVVVVPSLNVHDAVEKLFTTRVRVRPLKLWRNKHVRLLNPMIRWVPLRLSLWQNLGVP